MAKILLVDDSIRDRLDIAIKLRSNKHKVIEANNGKEALEMYKKSKPDIVFMDMIMPVLDGIAACEKIKQHDPSAIIIYLAGLTFIRDQEVKSSIIASALNKGAVDYIEKPFQYGQMESKLQQYKPHIEERKTTFRKILSFFRLG